MKWSESLRNGVTGRQNNSLKDKKALSDLECLVLSAFESQAVRAQTISNKIIHKVTPISDIMTLSLFSYLFVHEGLNKRKSQEGKVWALTRDWEQFS